MRQHTRNRSHQAIRQCSGWDEVPCQIVDTLEDAATALKIERDENECRKDLSREEAARLGKKLKALLEPEAKKRHREGSSRGGSSKEGSEKITEPSVSSSKPAIRDTVGKAIGMIGPTFTRAATVVDAADNHPKNEIIESLSRSKARRQFR